MICISYHMSIKEDEMVGACDMYGEELDVDGRVTLKCILM